MKVEINRIFNNKCLCFGIEFHWNSFLGIEIHFLSYNLTIIFKEPAPEFVQKIKSYSNGKVYPPEPWLDPPDIFSHWDSREWWDR